MIIALSDGAAAKPERADGAIERLSIFTPHRCWSMLNGDCSRQSGHSGWQR
jgi:hypothetical protein